MNFIELVEKKKIDLRKQAITEIREQIDNKWVKDKIKNHLARFPFLAVDDIEERILNDDLIASFFCKDPTRQSVSERLAAELLAERKILPLPGSGTRAIRFDEKGEITGDTRGSTKSADFYSPKHDCYITQKYTMNQGGAQDNQKIDVIDFLRRGSLKYRVMAILDGEYWEEKRGELRELFEDNPNVVITSISEMF